MTENTVNASSELDLDAWLLGGSRNTQIVKLYARNDLHAEILQLEAQLVPEKRSDEPDLDASLSDVDEAKMHNDELRTKIDTLWVQLSESVKEFRVAGRTGEETMAIEAQIREDLKAEIDAAAGAGRAKGKTRAGQLGIVDPAEINRFVRSAALEAMDVVVQSELGVRTIAASTTVKVGGAWLPVSADQVRALYSALGEPQVEMLARAASRTANEAPEVTLPK